MSKRIWLPPELRHLWTPGGVDGFLRDRRGALMVPHAGFANCSTNITGTPSTTPGTSVTFGASNAKGSYTELLADLTHDVEYVVVGFGGNVTATTDTSSLADIGIDRGGGTTYGDILIPDLLTGYIPASTTGGFRLYGFPVWIPQGAAVACRGQNVTASTRAVRCAIWAFGSTKNKEWWCGQKVTALGINSGTSKGTSHTPGNSGSFSTWTNFGSTLAQPGGYTTLGLQGPNGNTGQTAVAYHWQIGSGSMPSGPTWWAIGNTGEYTQGPIPFFGCLKRWAEGTQLQIRATCSGTAQAYDAAMYVVS